jgi:hypothetical protein
VYVGSLIEWGRSKTNHNPWLSPFCYQFEVFS